MPFWNRLFKKDRSAVAEADEEETSSSDAIDESADEDEIGAREGPASEEGEIITERDADGKPRRSFFRKFESNIRRKVDGYVDNKAGELLDDATIRAQHFRQETLDEVRANAMDLLDLTENRIDEKLVEIEKMLEKRLQAELKMRLRAMMWTLVFVLVMALVSFAYVWVKRTSGLETANQPAAEQHE